MLSRPALVLLVLSLPGCIDTALPPTPGPGSIQGNLRYALPGRVTLLPAVGAELTVLRTGLEARSQDEGRFLITGITQSTGTLLISLDLDGDGQIDRQRTLELLTLGAGFGRHLSLGDVVLGRNAEVHGAVSLQGSTSTGGRGGISVFVPGGPWSTYTADDGTYALTGLPEGELQVAFYKSGFAPASADVRLDPGEQRQLPVVELVPATEGPATVHGILRTPTASASDAQARVRHLGMERSLPVDAQGRFAGEGLTSGLHSFAFERTGSRSIVLYNLLLPPGDTDLGTMVLTDGDSTPVTLTDLGPYVPRDAGIPDSGMPDAGTVDAGPPDSGTPDAGVTDAGTPDAGTVDAGTPDAGPPLPVAVITGPDTANPNTQVTLSGAASTGDFPLVYHWRQVSGTTVTLTPNDTPQAHTPRFTAPGAGTLLEFELVVQDRLGVESLPVFKRVGIGATPIARFNPDGGLLAAGQRVPLSSTSYDDGGLAIVGFDWQLTAGTGGTLESDGGAFATWLTPTFAFGAPDVIGGITLRVTNAVGARSAPFTQFYTVRALSPNNWTLDAGPAQNVNVGTVPPQVQLSASVAAPLVANPQYTLAWTCPSSVAVVGGDTLTPRFLAPVVAGPTQTLTCQVTATGQAPLDPPSLSGTVNLFLRDTAPPQVVSSNVEPTRMSRFGFVLTANEAITTATITCSPGLSYGNASRVINKSVIAGPSYGTFAEGSTQGAFQVDLADRSPSGNAVNNLGFGPAASVPVQTLWVGPYESTTAFDDPRPVVSTLSQLPREVQELNGVMPGSVTGYELLATQNGDLVRFSGLDLGARPSCEPPCAMNSTTQALGLSPGAPLLAARTQYAGAELFVSTSTDGGLAPLAAHRSASGTWTRFSGLTGTPGMWDLQLRTARFDAASSQVLLDSFVPATGAFVTTDLAATGVTSVIQAAHGNDFLAYTTGATRQLVVRKRNPVDLTWSNVTVPAVTDVTALSVVPLSSGVTLLAYETTTRAVLQRLDTGGTQTVSSTPVQGFAAVGWGGQTYLAYGLNGDIRLKTIAGSVWSGAGGGPVDFGGPPRTGFTAPYPVMLDGNPLCEAAYPHLDFVEEALVVTWQERCAPATQWKVMARVIR